MYSYVICTCKHTDEHTHRRVGTPGKIHDMRSRDWGVSAMCVAMGIGSVGPTHGCTSVSRYGQSPY